MIWTENDIEQMMQLWNGGSRSMSEIAAIMGVRKNQVVGRMRREKIRRGIPFDDHYSHPSKFIRPKKVNPHQPVKKPVSNLPVPDFSNAVSIVDVEGCRWAVSYDDNAPGGHLFCNHAVESGSYCPYHAQENVADYSQTLVRKTIRSALSVYTRRAA